MKTALLAVLPSLAIALAAAPQPFPDIVKTESSQFTISRDGKKIGKEDFSIKVRKGGGYIAEATTRLNADKTPLMSRMELDGELRPVFYEYRRGEGIIRLRIDKASSEYEVVSEAGTKTVKFQFPENGFIVDNNFFHHIQLLLDKMKRSPGQVSLMVPQDLRMDVVTLRRKEGRPFEFEIEADITLQIVLDPADGRLLRLVAPANGVVVER